MKNASNMTIEQQPEWFLLGLSSYKMKKYGECLFAISKAANAVQKRDKQQILMHRPPTDH